MFERFTDEARQGVVHGQQEAYAEADAVGTEHLILGLLDQGDELVAEALKGAGFPERAPRASPPYPPPVRTAQWLAPMSSLDMSPNGAFPPS